VTTIAFPPRSVSLRPLALPNEHGGWGFLFEPIVLGLLVAPSWSGALLGLAALCAFLARHPLKLALQDAMRGRRYPRTPYCWMLAASYLFVAAIACGSVVALSGRSVLVPLGAVAPLALIQVLYDARNRSRDLLPELCGAAAMTSIAAAIGIAGGLSFATAFSLSAVVLARSLPSIVYVRTLLRGDAKGPALVMHVGAVAVVAIFASPYAVAAMVVLLLRALWGLTHETPPAKTIGWREIVYGALVVALAAI
jgi:hypothetical protein